MRCQRRCDLAQIRNAAKVRGTQTYGAREKQAMAALKSWPAWNDSKMLPCKPLDLDKYSTCSYRSFVATG